MTYRLIAPALFEYKESLLFYLEEAGSAVDFDFDEEVTAVLASICAAPFQNKQIAPGIREKLLDVFPFSLIYSVQGSEVVVLAVKHHRRKADYWTGRIS